MKTIHFILNIGLSRPDGQPDNTVAGTLASLPPCGEYSHRLSLGNCEQGQEPVLIITGAVTSDSLQAYKLALHDTALKLCQDCIAIAYPNGNGELLGPKPYKGGFNPAFFQC